VNIGIDLLYVKHKQVGGIESYIRNLMDGFAKYAGNEFKFFIFTSLDNYESFKCYLNHPNFSNILCNVESGKVSKRLIWESLHIDNLAKKNNIDMMFIPVYNKPFFTHSGIPYITVIHDLQMIHYPQYSSKLKLIWMQLSWKNALKTSKRIIAISNYVKDDILTNFKVNSDKIKVINNPIVTNSYQKKMVEFEKISKHYCVEENNYFYTVSSMELHKNLKTVLKVMKNIIDNKLELPNKLVITGVGGKGKESLYKLIEEYNLKNKVVLTGFISNEERDCLYKNCKIFLFPSVFEGFGMPPIEALMYGKNVVTTNCASIPEVTNNKAIYVMDPFDVNEWIEKIKIAVNKVNNPEKFSQYELEKVCKCYLKEFAEIK